MVAQDSKCWPYGLILGEILSSLFTMHVAFPFSSTSQLIIIDLLVWFRFGIVIFISHCVLPDLAVSFWSVV